MKRILHWTPRYMYHRLVRYGFEKTHPGSPSLALGAVHFLDGWLDQRDMVLEYGAGQSTAWFARRVGHIVSVEDSRFWYDKVNAQVAGYTNVELSFFEFNENDYFHGCGVSWD